MKSVSQCVILFVMAALSCSAQLTITTTALPDAIVGQPYPIISLRTSGAIGAVTWSIVSGALPSGFVVGLAQTGQPAANGTFCLGTQNPVPNAPPDCDTTTGVSSIPNPYTFTILAVDAQNQAASEAFTLNVNPGLTLTSASSFFGIVGTPFSQTLTASGGQAPFTWSILTGTLPHGLTLDPVSGQITGTPAFVETDTISFKRTDSLGQAGAAVITITVFLKLTLQAPLPNVPGAIGNPYDQSVAMISPTKGPYTFAIIAGTLPPGLILDTASGHAQGTPAASGTFPFTVQVTDSLGQTATATQSIVVFPALSIVTKTLSFELGVPPSENPSVSSIQVAVPSGFAFPFCSVVGGALPPGLGFGVSPGVGCTLLGTPTSSGLYLATVQARAGNGLIVETTTADVSFNVVSYVSINTTSLPNGTIGSAYSQALVTFGGSAPFSWQVIHGNLPAGLALDASTGVISGSPSAVGPQTFTVGVTDSLQATTQATLTLTVPSMTTGNAQFGVQQLLQISAEPGQSVADLKTDSHGNLIVAALVPVSSFVFNGTVKKIDTAGNLVFSVVLPGIFAPTLTVDANDDIEVNGFATAPDSFPATSAITPSIAGVSSQFVMKIRGADGTAVYSTLVAPIAQPSIDPATVAAVDGAGRLFVAAQGPVTDLRATSGAYSEGNNGLGFPNPTPVKIQLSRISAGGNQLDFSLIYGGGQTSCSGSVLGCMNSVTETLASRIMLDAQGNIWVAGTTNAGDLAVSPVAIKTHCGCDNGPDNIDSHDGFLAEFSPDGSTLLYGTFIGAVSIPVGLPSDDRITSAVRDAGHIWMVGTTNGIDFPVTADALQSHLGGGVDAFIAEYDPATNQLLYATYFGGGQNDSITKIELASDGNLVFTGTSLSPALPVPVTGFQRGSEFVGRIDSVTHAITLTGLLGGSTGSGIAFMPDGSPVVGGPSNVATVLQTNASSAPAIYGVVNSAGIAVTGQVAGEELMSLYGVKIGPPVPVAADLSTGQAPTQLAGVEVLVDGVPVPLLYAQGDQINAIVPAAAASQSLIDVQVSNEGTVSTHATLGIVPAEPEVFQWSDGSGAIALNEDGSLNSEDNPANPLSMVTVFATGLGLLNPLPPDGQVITGTLPALTSPVHVTGAGSFVQASASPVSGSVAGIFQVAFQASALSGGGSRNFFQLVVGGRTSAGFGISMR